MRVASRTSASRGALRPDHQLVTKRRDLARARGFFLFIVEVREADVRSSGGASISVSVSLCAGRGYASGRVGGGLLLRLTCDWNPAWTARIPRAPQLRRPPRARRRAAFNGRGWRTGGFRPRRPGSPAQQAPAHPAAATPRHVEKREAAFERGLGIDGPSRPRRCPRPAAWRAGGLDAN